MTVINKYVQTGAGNVVPLVEPTIFRNRLINGNFDFWQRGTSQTVVGYGSADRFYLGFGGSSCTMSQQVFTLGQTDVPGEPKYYARFVVSSVAGAGNFVQLVHRIEGVRVLAGQTATLSFYAKADASKNICTEFMQSFGTGGSPSGAVLGIAPNTISLTTAWKRYSISVSIPSISGKTFGTSGDDMLALNIWFDAGTNYSSRTNSLGQQSGTFDIAQVQLEPGTVATPFEFRPYGTELALCQRYYWKSSGYVYLTACGTTNSLYGMLPVKVPMRAAPAVTYGWTIPYTDNKVYRLSNATVIDMSGVGLVNIAQAEGSFQTYNTALSTLVVPEPYASYVTLSAEL